MGPVINTMGQNMTPGQHEQQAYILQPGVNFSDFFFEFLVMRRSQNFDNWTELLAYKLFRDYMELWGYPVSRE